MLFIKKLSTLCLALLCLISLNAFAEIDGNANVNCNLHGNDYKDEAYAKQVVDYITAKAEPAEMEAKAEAVD